MGGSQPAGQLRLLSGTPGPCLEDGLAKASRGRILHVPTGRQRRSLSWSLNCEGCDKFVISGADLLYWRRKREQWRSIAECAPDDKTADYLHKVFEPTSRAIEQAQ